MMGACRRPPGREVAGRPLALPMLDVHTVGAGGGSIAWRDAGGALRVGPHRPGREPGPACYGRGGERPTVTDANLLLGYLDAGSELAGGVRLDRGAAEAAVAELAGERWSSRESSARRESPAWPAPRWRARCGWSAWSAGPIRGVTRCCPSAGPGPMHAAAVADELGMTRVLCPPASGVLAALGLVVGERRRDVQRSVLRRGDELSDQALERDWAQLGEQAREELGDPQAPLRATFELRYAGQAFELPVTRADAPPPAPTCAKRSRRAHEERYGHRDRDGEVELVTLRMTAAVPGPQLDLEAGAAAAGGQGRCTPDGRREAIFAGQPHQAELWRGAPAAGARLAGPAICELAEATLVVPPGWHGAGHGDRSGADGARAVSAGLDPITLQVLTGALHAACEEMGAVLVRSAHSANIKERRDASTALFDPAGQMVMQAEHIPVHLGAMPAAVEAVLDVEHAPGRSWVLNDPYRGGTHLPDVTVITPAFMSTTDGGELLGFAASRAHHADVGGRVPGSMPADSRTLEEEGVVIEPQPLDEETIAGLVARCVSPSSAGPTCARRWPPTAPACGGCASWPSARASRPCVRR